MKTFSKEMLQEAASIIDEVKDPYLQYELIYELLTDNGYNLDDFIDLVNALTPTVK